MGIAATEITTATGCASGVITAGGAVWFRLAADTERLHTFATTYHPDCGAVPNGNAVAPGSSYTAGVFTVEGLTAGVLYRVTFGAHELSLTNGGDTLTESGEFVAAWTTVTLASIAGQEAGTVTAGIVSPVVSTRLTVFYSMEANPDAHHLTECDYLPGEGWQTRYAHWEAGSLVTVPTQIGLTYMVKVDGIDGDATGNFKLRWSSRTANWCLGNCATFGKPEADHVAYLNDISGHVGQYDFPFFDAETNEAFEPEAGQFFAAYCKGAWNPYGIGSPANLVPASSHYTDGRFVLLSETVSLLHAGGRYHIRFGNNDARMENGADTIYEDGYFVAEETVTLRSYIGGESGEVNAAVIEPVFSAESFGPSGGSGSLISPDGAYRMPVLHSGFGGGFDDSTTKQIMDFFNEGQPAFSVEDVAGHYGSIDFENISIPCNHHMEREEEGVMHEIDIDYDAESFRTNAGGYWIAYEEVYSCAPTLWRAIPKQAHTFREESEMYHCGGQLTVSKTCGDGSNPPSGYVCVGGSVVIALKSSVGSDETITFDKDHLTFSFEKPAGTYWIEYVSGQFVFEHPDHEGETRSIADWSSPYCPDFNDDLLGPGGVCNLEELDDMLPFIGAFNPGQFYGNYYGPHHTGEIVYAFGSFWKCQYDGYGFVGDPTTPPLWKLIRNRNFGYWNFDWNLVPAWYEHTTWCTTLSATEVCYGMGVEASYGTKEVPYRFNSSGGPASLTVKRDCGTPTNLFWAYYSGGQARHTAPPDVTAAEALSLRYETGLEASVDNRCLATPVFKHAGGFIKQRVFTPDGSTYASPSPAFSLYRVNCGCGFPVRSLSGSWEKTGEEITTRTGKVVLAVQLRNQSLRLYTITMSAGGADIASATPTAAISVGGPANFGGEIVLTPAVAGNPVIAGQIDHTDADGCEPPANGFQLMPIILLGFTLQKTVRFQCAGQWYMGVLVSLQNIGNMETHTQKVRFSKAVLRLVNGSAALSCGNLATVTDNNVPLQVWTGGSGGAYQTRSLAAGSTDGSSMVVYVPWNPLEVTKVEAVPNDAGEDGETFRFEMPPVPAAPTAVFTISKVHTAVGYLHRYAITVTCADDNSSVSWVVTSSLGNFSGTGKSYTFTVEFYYFGGQNQFYTITIGCTSAIAEWGMSANTTQQTVISVF